MAMIYRGNKNLQNPKNDPNNHKIWNKKKNSCLDQVLRMIFISFFITNSTELQRQKIGNNNLRVKILM